MTDNTGLSSWPAERSSVAARLQSLRELLSSERNSDANPRALDALNQEISDRSADRESTAPRRRRRDLDTHLQMHEQSTTQEAPSVGQYMSAENHVVRRRLPAHAQRLMRMPNVQNESSQSDTYEISTSPRRALPPTDHADPIPDQYHPVQQAVRDQRCRAKRRKLDDGTFDDGSRVVSYGDKGRVTPGPLRMQIVSSDGEEYEEPGRSVVQYILQDDTLVYSTRSNRCNLLMKHVGGMPFALTKLVFRAPRDGYEAPVQEGMVFVAMDDEKLVEKTAPYDFNFSPRGYRHHYPRRHDIYRPSQDYMSSTRSPLRSIDRARYLRDPYAHRLWFHYGENSPEIDTSLVPGFEVSFADPAESEEPQSFSPRSPRQWTSQIYDYQRRPFVDRYRHNFNDNLSYVELSATSEESEDEESSTGPRPAPSDEDFRAAISLNRQLLDRRRVDEANLMTFNPENRPAPDDWQDLQRVMNSRRSDLSRSNHRDIESDHHHHHRPSAAVHPSSSASKGLEGTSSGLVNHTLPADLLSPHARFSVNRHKSSIAINFTPAVSGRYILIKLWAACPNANIDVQSVIAYGYGGPRFFPAIDLR